MSGTPNKKLPTFLIPGAAKSGTTSLWNYLKAHPDIGMAEKKEPAFFSRNPGRYGGGDLTTPTAEGKYDRGLDWYRSLYEHCSDKPERGEASTLYFIDPESPELIKKHIPDVKLVFILRDPVERLYSHYWQGRKSGWELPAKFETAYRERHPLLQTYAHVSNYKLHLKRYLRQFDDEQLLILIQNKLNKQPEQVIQHVFSFLNVDVSFTPPNLEDRFNTSSIPRFEFLQKLIRTGLLGKSFHLIKRQFGNHLQKRLESWKEKIKKLNETSNDYPPLSSDLREELQNEYKSDIQFVEDYLGRELTDWRLGGR